MKPQKTLFDDIPLSIGDLTVLIKSVVEKTFQQVYAVGEISSFSRVSSGHCYFTLKDTQAQIPAVVWNSTAARLKFQLQNGMEVLCRGRLEVYAPHGKYQFIISQIEPKGIGALQLAFQQLHAKLGKEGLFLPERKKPMPRTIRRVAVITSITGAAIRDFLNVVGRRTRRLETIIVPVKVQGEGASLDISNAFERVNTAWLQDRPDCIALIRGGGSIEDLWTFNEEPVVRAVAASGLPVISGIGHEIDVSLCDLAADLRALTPTDAAMRLTQDDADLVRAIADLGRRLHRNIDLRMEQTSERLRRYAAHPLFTDTENRIILPRQNMLDRLAADCARGIDLRLERSRQSLGKTAAKLESLSPLSVLSRGYSLTQTQDGDIVHQADDVALGQTVVTRLAQGWLESSVTNKGKE